jgi:uncharacterized protein (TIGR02611 family)
VISKTARITYKAAKRIVIAIVGGTMVLLGIVMIVTPGPGLLGIAIGLGILGVEFTWARLWLKRLRESISNGMSNSRSKRAESHRERAER